MDGNEWLIVMNNPNKLGILNYKNWKIVGECRVEMNETILNFLNMKMYRIVYISRKSGKLTF